MTRKHLDILLFGSLLLLGAYVVRGWLHESDDRSAHGSPPPVPVPALKADAVVVLDRVDPAKDKIAGDWTLKEGRLLSPAVQWARLQLPIIPPEEYDLDGVITRKDKDDALILGLVYQGRQCQVVIDGNGGKATWMEVTNGGHGVTPFGVTFFEGNVFGKGRAAQLHVSVRKSRLTVSVDSFRILDYIGTQDPLYIADHWEAPDTRALYLGAYETVFAVDHLTLTPVQGAVVFTR